jgi:hypothetical protein
MGIDILQESPISLTEAARQLPRRRQGRRTATSTLYRWATAGCRGAILEPLQVGGIRCTSLAALQRFFEALTAAAGTPTVRLASAQQRTAQANRELDRRWPKKGSGSQCRLHRSRTDNLSIHTAEVRH